MTNIYFENGKVTKEFNTLAEAKRIVNLYNSFSKHVNAEQRLNTIVYNYIPGNTLEETIITNPDLAIQILEELGTTLAQIHFKDYQTTNKYENSCKNRAHYTKKEDFIPSIGYWGTIHGDLNTQNIIVSEKEKIVFIDRMEEKGDILFDFPFIMSILCKYENKKNHIYKSMINSFLKPYKKESNISDDFFVSFRNNFLNYGYYIYGQKNNKPPFFQEWKFAKKVSNDLVRHESFLDYVEEM